MSAPVRPSSYTALAYRRALLQQCIAHLTSYTAVMGSRPVGEIISDDLIRSESIVPEEVIDEFIIELQQEEETVRLELSRFEFVKKEADGNREQKDPQGQRGGPKKAAKKAR